MSFQEDTVENTGVLLGLWLRHDVLPQKEVEWNIQKEATRRFTGNDDQVRPAYPVAGWPVSVSPKLTGIVQTKFRRPSRGSRRVRHSWWEGVDGKWSACDQLFFICYAAGCVSIRDPMGVRLPCIF